MVFDVPIFVRPPCGDCGGMIANCGWYADGLGYYHSWCGPRPFVRYSVNATTPKIKNGQDLTNRYVDAYNGLPE